MLQDPETEALLEKVAEIVYEFHRDLQEVLEKEYSPPWENALDWEKDAYKEGAWEVMLDPYISPQQFHKCWCTTRAREGWVLGAVLDVERKLHPDLKAFAQLQRPQQLKIILTVVLCQAALSSMGVF